MLWPVMRPRSWVVQAFLLEAIARDALGDPAAGRTCCTHTKARGARPHQGRRTSAIPGISDVMLTHARQGSDETRSVSRRRFHARTHVAFRAEEFDGRVEVVVGTITANRETWLATMMDEELHLQPVQAPDIMRSAIVITVATLIGHLIPLLPFVWLSRTTALVTAIVLSALALFGVGVYESVTLVGDWRKNGLKMVAIGLGAAAVGFLIGRLFHTTGA